MSTAILSTRHAEFSLLEVCLPGRSPVAAGVVLRDPATGDFRLRFRRDWESFAGEEAEVLSLLADDLASKLSEPSAEDWLRLCEDSLSHTLRLSPRESVLAADLDKTADRLYSRHVHPNILPFVTHLPKYSARVAAGRFLEDNQVEAEEWIETPENLRLDPGMFIVQITGHSMEPRIPDGSLCVFRAPVTGSRQGKLLLIERRDVSESGGRYTVKRYRSEKTPAGEEWRHGKIRLEPLNPDFEAWELDNDPDLFHVIGEFIRVLD
jgi:SOS-response transcriptional repressor LexA